MSLSSPFAAGHAGIERYAAGLADDDMRASLREQLLDTLFHAFSESAQRIHADLALTVAL